VYDIFILKKLMNGKIYYILVTLMERIYGVPYGLITGKLHSCKHEYRYEGFQNAVNILIAKTVQMNELGVYHLDLHESNMMVTPTNAYIIDFGKSRFMEEIKYPNLSRWFDSLEYTNQDPDRQEIAISIIDGFIPRNILIELFEEHKYGEVYKKNLNDTCRDYRLVCPV
jgi:predicted unusual protein kinase regulating ubiquinone biosynthesis (AarF/ABC1/UbiB family)